ncbi:UPF0496 protein At1g20180-like [Prosopis cineraria]|uniref:UPF0496 protein At1g20180-like n=1 Tax=Prosopis cineraria TaxID=364024 RepID=UPI00240FF8A0|nr:UPF0496 protein At1g20180-like [Prosopis cineraria]
MEKFRAGKKVINKDDNNVEDSINVQEEYRMALRTKSYADFFTKAQNLLTNKPSFYDNHIKLSEILLEPGQETIPSILNDSSILSQKPELKHLMLSYFDITASASHFCIHLLESINLVHSNYLFIRRALDIIEQHEHKHKNHQEEDSNNFELVAFELESFILSTNPFSNPDNFNFQTINDNNSSVFQRLKAMRKNVVRKIKCIKYTKKASTVCAALACGVIAIAAAIIATHTLTAIIMGPAILSFPMKSFKRKVTQRVRVLRSSTGFLGKVRDQLDVAAKGTYILSRDFDTTSRLVARLHSEIERNKEMVRFWMGRKEEEKLGLEIVKEMRKSEVGFRKQVEELEEHVYLCLVTINRARSLVVKEMLSRIT